jgi:hypothetical protein
MKQYLALALAAISVSACAVVPQTAPAGILETEGDFSVTLERDWSRWPSQINADTTGEFITQDGVLLNRVHLVSIPDEGSLVRPRRGVEMPIYLEGASEFEVIEFVTSSLEMIGYHDVEAADIRPVDLDDQRGLRFALTGVWQNGLRVRGDVATLPHDDQLDVVLFMAPELHYYDALSAEVDGIIASINHGAD